MGRNNRHNNQQRAQRRQQRPPAGLQLVSPRTGIATGIATTQGALAVASNADPNAAERRGGVSLLFAERGATGGGSAAFQQQQYAAAQAQMAYSTRVNQAQGMWNPTGKPYPQMPEVPDNKPLLQAMGATGTAIFSGIIASEEYNSDFYWKDAIAIYEQMMRNDAQVFATINLMEEPIRRCTWSIEPASQDPVDIEIASFIESCLFHDMVMETTEGRKLTQKWDDILRHILMSFRFGFSAFEQVWRIEDGWVKWARWEPLLPRTVWRWWVGDDNQLVGIQQWTFKNYSYRFIDIPADKLLLFVHRQEGNNYDGVSVLRSAYKHWWYKQNFEKIEAIDIERNAVAVPVIGLPESFSNADVQAAEKILANLRANQSMGVTLPPGWTFEYARNFAKTTTQVQPSIQYHDVMIARNILGQFLNLGSTEAGSYALAATHLDLFRSLLQAEVEWIEDVINTDAIPRLCDYNYDGIAVYPKIKASKIAAQDVGVITDALSKLCNMPTPLITPGPEIEDFLRKELGLPSAPASQIEGTNPTQDQEPPEDSEDEEGEDDGYDENTTQESTSTSGRPVASAPGTGDEGPAGTSEGVSGMLLREQVQEARLLRETLALAYGQDAVDRGMTFYAPTQPRGRDGRWIPAGGGRQPGGGGAGGGGAPAGAGGARAARGAGVNRGAHGAGAAGGGRQRQGRQRQQRQQRQQQPKVVKVEDVAKANKVKQRENEKVRKAAVGQHRKDLAAARKKEGEEKAKYRQAQKDFHAAYKARQDAQKAARQQIDAQRGPNRLRGNQGWAREEIERDALARQATAVKAAKREADAKGRAYARAEHAYHVAVGERVIAENRFNNAAQNIPGLKAAPKTADIQARMKTRDDAQMHALRAQAIHDADHAVVREENGHWTGDKALEPPFSAEQFGRAALKPLSGAGINTSYTATIGGRKYLIKNVLPGAVMHGGAKVDNPERYETHAEAASVRIAEAMGMGHVVHGTYAFEHGGKQYVAVQWKAGMRPVGWGGARHVAFNNLPEADLRTMWLHEYVVADPDRHGGNYLINLPKNGNAKALEIDHGRSLRLNELDHFGGKAADAWENKVGGGHFASRPGDMHFDRVQLLRIVRAEPRILATVHQFHLQAGEDGVRARLSVLRDLAKVADPTMKDFRAIVVKHERQRHQQNP